MVGVTYFDWSDNSKMTLVSCQKCDWQKVPKISLPLGDYPRRDPWWW